MMRLKYMVYIYLVLLFCLTSSCQFFLSIFTLAFAGAVVVVDKESIPPVFFFLSNHVLCMYSNVIFVQFDDLLARVLALLQQDISLFVFKKENFFLFNFKIEWVR